MISVPLRRAMICKKVTSFFADDGAYRMSERQEPSKGRQAVTEKINSFLGNVVKFEVLETFARGPMVFNERIDHFQNLNIKSGHGVGVFFCGMEKSWSG